MSEIREMAARIVMHAAEEIADENRDDVSALFDCQHGFLDALRQRAMDILEAADGRMPDTPPSPDEMERLIGESGLSMDMLDSRAREAYGNAYSTVFDRYLCAIGWCVDDMLGWE